MEVGGVCPPDLICLLGHRGRVREVYHYQQCYTLGVAKLFMGTRALGHQQIQLFNALIEGLMTSRPFGRCKDEHNPAPQCIGRNGPYTNSSDTRQEGMHLVRKGQWNTAGAQRRDRFLLIARSDSLPRGSNICIGQWRRYLTLTDREAWKGPSGRRNSTSLREGQSWVRLVPCGWAIGLARGLVGEHTRMTSWCKGGGSELSGRESGDSVKVCEQGSVMGVMTISAGARGLQVRGCLFRYRIFHRYRKYMTHPMVRRRKKKQE